MVHDNGVAQRPGRVLELGHEQPDQPRRAGHRVAASWTVGDPEPGRDLVAAAFRQELVIVQEELLDAVLHLDPARDDVEGVAADQKDPGVPPAGDPPEAEPGVDRLHDPDSRRARRRGRHREREEEPKSNREPPPLGAQRLAPNEWRDRPLHPPSHRRSPSRCGTRAAERRIPAPCVGGCLVTVPQVRVGAEPSLGGGCVDAHPGVVGFVQVGGTGGPCEGVSDPGRPGAGHPDDQQGRRGRDGRSGRRFRDARRGVSVVPKRRASTAASIGGSAPTSSRGTWCDMCRCVQIVKASRSAGSSCARIVFWVATDGAVTKRARSFNAPQRYWSIAM